MTLNRTSSLQQSPFKGAFRPAPKRTTKHARASELEAVRSVAASVTGS